MKNLKKLFVLGLVTAISFAASAMRFQSTERGDSSSFVAGCLVPDSTVIRLRDGLVTLMGRSGALADTMLSVKGVVRVATSQISIVSDTTVCRRAANAYSYAIAATDSNRSVHAVKAGIRYVVLDPSITGGEYKLGITFDSSFTQTLSKFGY